ALAGVVALAELLGARVHGEPIFRRVNFPGDHPLWRGGLFPSPPGVRKALDGADALLVVGATVFTWFLHAPGEPFPRGLPVVQIDDDPWEIGRSYRVTLGLLGNVRLGLVKVHEAVAARMNDGDRAAARQRTDTLARTRAEHAGRL